LLIAGLSHDIDKAFRWKGLEEEYLVRGLTDVKALSRHQQECARIIGAFLEELKVNPEMVERVKWLVSKHEEGGDRDQNLLKDADSISFFENNVWFFVNRARGMGKDQVRKKFEWMYNRITSREAKQIVERWYKKALSALENV
jgi:hypothetical protein